MTAVVRPGTGEKPDRPSYYSNTALWINLNHFKLARSAAATAGASGFNSIPSCLVWLVIDCTNEKEFFLFFLEREFRIVCSPGRGRG